MRLKVVGRKLKPSTRAKVSVPDKVADPFYTSPQWRTFVDRLKIERFGSALNARCQDHQCRTPERRCRVFGDHTIEIKDGGPRFDPHLILFRCGSCHTRVTAERRGVRHHQGVG